MQRAVVMAILFLALPASAPLVSGQGPTSPCVTASWTDVGEVRTVVRPEIDEYRGRIRFTTRQGCSTVSSGCPDSGSQNAVFEILNQQQPWLVGNFTTNPVAVNGSGGTFGTRVTENEIFFRLDRTAPFESSFLVQVRARCDGGLSSTTSRSFRVGSLVDVTADVIGASTLDEGAQWVIRITNRGNVPVMTEFEPHPSQEEAGIRWNVPEFQLIPVAEGEAESIAVAVTVSVEGERIPGNLSLILRMREAEDRQAPPFEFELALPYTVFTGESTPAPSIALLFLLGALLVARRRA